MQEIVQGQGNYNVNFNLDASLITKISKECASQSLKDVPNYFRFAKYRSGKRCYGFSLDEIGFLYGTFAKSHFRLIGIAVTKEHQGKGCGSYMLSVLFEECLKRGIRIITLKTSKTENAYLWYKKFGAKVTGQTDNDYEMRIDL